MLAGVHELAGEEVGLVLFVGRGQLGEVGRPGGGRGNFGGEIGAVGRRDTVGQRRDSGRGGSVVSQDGRRAVEVVEGGGQRRGLSNVVGRVRGGGGDGAVVLSVAQRREDSNASTVCSLRRLISTSSSGVCDPGLTASGY